jgi:CubicO group peptidase (beta-lactamase class C family)
MRKQTTLNNPGRAAVCSLLIVSSAAFADAQLGREIDAVFTDIDSKSEPGCAAGVIHNGEYIHKAGYGMANLEYDIPITPQTMFRTGSLSKQFTAMSIAILAERGELDLDADVHTYLPDLMEYGHEVTIRQMVHHIAGMGDYDHEALRKPDGSEFRFGNEDYSTIEEFYQVVASAGLIHVPGSQYEYSNLAYFLLSHVVESVSGKTLRAFAADEIFGPLDMSASFFNDNVNQPVRNRADGYRLMDDGSWEIFMTNLSYVGDGGVYTNLDDFIKWDQNFYSNKLGKGGDSLIELVTTPHPDTIENTEDGPRNVNYAFGLLVDEVNGEYMIGHTGGWVAFSTIYNRYPDLNLSVVVFCNSTEVSGPDLGRKVAELAVASVKK